MTSTEICQIIESCAKNGVISFKGETFSLKLDSKPIVNTEIMHDNDYMSGYSEEINEERNADNTEELLNDYILSDPVLYEESQSGELDG